MRTLLLAFLVLCGGRGLTRAETLHYTAKEGEDFREKFVFYEPAKQKILCKNDCEKKENILVETSGTTAQNGRYSIEFEQQSSPHVLNVGITNLSSSDSGLYMWETWSGGVKTDTVIFQIEVSRAATLPAPPSVTVSSFHKETSTAGPPVSTASPKETSRTTHGPSVSSAVQNQTTETNQRTSGQSFNPVLLYVALAAALFLLLVPLALILYWKKRGNKPKASIERSQTSEKNHVYEEVSDGNRAAPVYSLLSEPQSRVEAGADTSAYSEVSFARSSSSSSAPRCQTGEGAGQTVLYSTITSQQQ